MKHVMQKENISIGDYFTICLILLIYLGSSGRFNRFEFHLGYFIL